MIAKIGRSSNLLGTLSYNNLKVENEKGKILLTNKIIETADGNYSVSQLARSFETYLSANRNTEKHTLHISLNPDPQDKLSDEQFREIAVLYMNEMGYGDQPFIVFKHTDIDRSHIHIVSVCVNQDGRKISDKFEKVRSMKVCRELEKKFGLADASQKESQQKEKICNPVNYSAGNIKSQISSVVKHLSTDYQFQSLGEYNALLALFNITVEKVEGELHGNFKQGLLYFPLDHQGKKAGNPFKSSLFGKNAGIDSLEKYFGACRNELNNRLRRGNLRKLIMNVLHWSKDEHEFRKRLAKEGIDAMVRKNDSGRIYGITFIDHQSKTVWNGSRLGKELSANAFNDYWTNTLKRENNTPVKKQRKISTSNDVDSPANIKDILVGLLNNSPAYEDSLLESLGGFIPLAKGEDDKEEDFSNNIKKKRKRRRK